MGRLILQHQTIRPRCASLRRNAVQNSARSLVRLALRCRYRSDAHMRSGAKRGHKSPCNVLWPGCRATLCNLLRSFRPDRGHKWGHKTESPAAEGYGGQWTGSSGKGDPLPSSRMGLPPTMMRVDAGESPGFGYRCCDTPKPIPRAPIVAISGRACLDEVVFEPQLSRVGDRRFSCR